MLSTEKDTPNITYQDELGCTVQVEPQLNPCTVQVEPLEDIPQGIEALSWWRMGKACGVRNHGVKKVVRGHIVPAIAERYSGIDPVSLLQRSNGSPNRLLTSIVLEMHEYCGGGQGSGEARKGWVEGPFWQRFGGLIEEAAIDAGYTPPKPEGSAKQQPMEQGGGLALLQNKLAKFEASDGGLSATPTIVIGFGKDRLQMLKDLAYHQGREDRRQVGLSYQDGFYDEGAEQNEAMQMGVAQGLG